MRPTNFKQETMELIGDHKVDYIFLMLIILLVNFSVIAWIGGLITRFWGNKIFIKTDKVEEI